MCECNGCKLSEAQIVSFKGKKYVLRQIEYVTSDGDGNIWYEASAYKLSDLANVFEQKHGKKLEEKDILTGPFRRIIKHSSGEVLGRDIEGYELDCVTVRWDLIDPEEYEEDDDEANACDWDNPSSVYEH